MSRFLFNDASLHGQFAAPAQFFGALGVIFRMRNAMQRAGFQLEVNRHLAERCPIGALTFREVINRITNPQNKRQVLTWLDRDGPFWDEPPIHSGNEYFECKGELVTNTALAEACNLITLLADTSVVSLNPSNFSINPIEVYWRARAEGDLSRKIQNFFSEPPLAKHLAQIEKPPASWLQVMDWVKANCSSLLLSPEILSQVPPTFYPNAAQRAQELFKSLNDINLALQTGNAARFQELRRLWMEGEKAVITDSSDGEKAEFAAELNFRHPLNGRIIACTWHAKIKIHQIRIHFEWPKQNVQDALFIGYFGPKLTKR